jgi:hypothetical protein
MIPLRFGRYSLGIALAVAMLAGCGGSQVGSQGIMPVVTMPGQAKAHGHSWMLPEARGENLLYVSDSWATGLVYVFSYPMGKHVGTLTGFDFPTGECVDKRGDVWILNISPEEVIEYAHGGASPIATLSNPVGGFSCSVDPASGDLAIASDDPAEVAIYKRAKGAATIYSDPEVPTFAACSYDDRGNLFIDSSGASDPLAELPKGGKSIIGIAFPAYSLGNIQWDGHYLAIQNRIHGNKGPATIDQVQVLGSAARIVSTTYLYANRNKQEGAGIQFWIVGDRILMPSVIRNGLDAVIGVWSYPGGGKPIKRFHARHPYYIFGVAVSPKR